MKTTRVDVAASVDITGATPILATIPAKSVKILEDSAQPTEKLLVQIIQPDGSFSNEVEFAAGLPIRVIRTNGVIARPPNYSADNVPTTGEPYVKIRTKSGNQVYVRVMEHENILPGQD